MEDSALIALIGLFFLIPLGTILLIILYALKCRRTVSYAPKKTGHYGWEDYLKLPHEKKQRSGRRHSFLKVFLIILGVAVLIGVAVMMLIPVFLSVGILSVPFGITSDLSKNVSMNGEVGQEVDATGPGGPPVEELGEGTTVPYAFLNLTAVNLSAIDLPGINVSLPELNISAFFRSVSRYVPYVIAGVIVLVILVLGIAAFTYVFQGRKLSVIKKARKTAEKLSKKNGKKAGEKPEATPGVPGFRNYTHLMAALIALLLLAITVYLFLNRIGQLVGNVFKLLAAFAGFLSAYMFYVLTGIAVLVVLIIVHRVQGKKAELKK